VYRETAGLNYVIADPELRNRGERREIYVDNVHEQ
jgi:hypothetical protein